MRLASSQPWGNTPLRGFRWFDYLIDMMISKDARVYVAGHCGLVGSAIWRELERQGYRQRIARTRAQVDLRDPGAVTRLFAEERPEYVFVAAAKVGGIMANDSEPADFLLENLQIQNNIIASARAHGVKKLLFLGSSCVYPKCAPQPLKEEYLLTGPLEPTNQWYAVAKIAGIKLCQAFRRQSGADFICAMPTNLYGPNDNYNLQTSHVLPALIRKFHEAREVNAPNVVCWGSGAPLREFLHADDLARACLFLMEHYSQEEIINVGSGHEISIRDLAIMVQRVIGYQGDVLWDTTKPDGTPRKLMDSSRLFNLGWRPRIDLEDGLLLAYRDFLDHQRSSC